MTRRTESTYALRIRRAEHLRTLHPFATEILSFYERICSLQQRTANQLQASLRQRLEPAAGNLRDQVDIERVLPQAGETLRVVAAHAPEPIAESIADFLRGSQNRQATVLQSYVDNGGKDEAPEDPLQELLARVVIDPYTELLAADWAAPSAVSAGNFCPNCAARPVVGVLRTEGDGGKRFLLCSFCAAEWEFRRILCAFCGETREDSLPVFVAEGFAHIRIEACDTCRHFIRTIDLTRDGNAVPMVDDLAAIPLALWAEESGYHRIHGNLLGT